MKSIIVSFLALMTAVASEKNVSRPISLLEISDRIADGKPAVAGQFPYLVAIKFDSLLCGGALIGPTWVLTAAHCTEGAASARVYLGVFDRNEPDLSFVVLNYNFIQHERFEWATWRHDIALIRIPRVEYTNNIKRIKLPSRKPPYPSHTGYRVIISGWGALADKTPYSFIPKHADMAVMSNEECSKLRPHIFESSICTAVSNGGGLCTGDEGNPMVFEDNQELIGITSRVSNACKNDHPAIFTRVTSYLDWILNNTGIEY